MATHNPGADPRAVDRDGFVTGYDRPTFGQRPSVGGLSACVQHDDRVGVIVGLDTTADQSGLLLHLVWLPDRNTSQRGEVDSEPVAAEGLIALDAYLPDLPDDVPDEPTGSLT
jgi:hypothetical protein